MAEIPLTPADELFVHQCPEPIAIADTTDRNFYDRAYLGAWTPDGEVFVAIAFGMYPHVGICDANITISVGDRQPSLHCSRWLDLNRLDLTCGPVSIEVVEPLRRVTAKVLECEGISLELTWTGRHFPLKEPRFTHRIGTKAFMDYTRMSQGCSVEGRVTVDGETHEFRPGSVGMRDRSWGIRNLGDSDPQPPAPAVDPQFFWLWAPAIFTGDTSYWHLNADAYGRPWNTMAARCGVGEEPESFGHGDGKMELAWREGTRWVESGVLTTEIGGHTIEQRYEPIRPLYMLGLGYFHTEWAHGRNHGEKRIEREDLSHAEMTPERPDHWHKELLCRVTRTIDGGQPEEGMGILEHLAVGPYEPEGFEGFQ